MDRTWFCFPMASNKFKSTCRNKTAILYFHDPETKTWTLFPLIFNLLILLVVRGVIPKDSLVVGEIRAKGNTATTALYERFSLLADARSSRERGSSLLKIKIPKEARWTFRHLYPNMLEFGRRQWHPTPVLQPGKSHGWRSLVGCSPWGCKESHTTKWLQFHFLLSCIGEGNGNPLQCSCLENPRDGGA